MGIKTDIEKIKKFQEEYQFIIDNKDKIHKLTNGLVSTSAINQMEHYIPALLSVATEMKDLTPDVEKAYDKVWDTMQKGFIECAYLYYSKQAHQDGKMLNKDEYFKQVVENIEQCPHEKIVQTKIWANIYNRAVTEKIHHNNEKMAEFFAQAEKIEDMYNRCDSARTGYASKRDGWLPSGKRVFEPEYGEIDNKANVKKLDDEIDGIVNSSEYKKARENQVEYKKEVEVLKVKKEAAYTEMNNANGEYNEVFAEAIKVGHEKSKEQFGYKEDVKTFKHHYEIYLIDKNRKLEAACNAQKELKEAYQAWWDKLDEVEKCEEKYELVENTLEEYRAELNAQKEEELKRYGERLDIQNKNKLKVGEDALKELEEDDLGIDIEEELKRSEEAFNKEKQELMDKYAKQLDEQIESKIEQLYESDEYQEKLEEAQKEIDKAQRIADKKKKEITFKIKDFREILTEKLPGLKKDGRSIYVHFLEKEYLFKEKLDSLKKEDDIWAEENLEYRKYLMNLDLPEEFKKLDTSAVREITEKLKPVEEKKQQKEEIYNKASAEVRKAERKASNIGILARYENKVHLQGNVHAYHNAKDTLHKVETELMSNDYTIEKPDVLTDIKRNVAELLAKKDFRKGIHKNTPEFNKMIESLTKVANLKKTDGPLKEQEALIEMNKSAQEYLYAKSLQNRKFPSAMRNFRKEFAKSVVRCSEILYQKSTQVEETYQKICEKANTIKRFKEDPQLVKEAPQNSKAKTTEFNAPTI